MSGLKHAPFYFQKSFEASQSLMEYSTFTSAAPTKSFLDCGTVVAVLTASTSWFVTPAIGQVVGSGDRKCRRLVTLSRRCRNLLSASFGGLAVLEPREKCDGGFFASALIQRRHEDVREIFYGASHFQPPPSVF
jgi:hypothetical protein